MSKVKSFGEVLKELRIERGIEPEVLAEGLYVSNMLELIEDGKRTPDRLMRDRLFDRVGVSVDDYEVMLGCIEYDKWLERQRIVESFLHDDEPLAERLVEEYADNNDMDNKLDKQFYLFMRAQLMHMRGGEECELARIYDEAVKLTVPQVDIRPIKDMALASQEINFILEYSYYNRSDDFIPICEELLEYIENGNYDVHNKSKIYPKLVYYMYRRFRQDMDNGKKATKSMLIKYLKLCNNAIEILRDSERLYYVIELLEARINIITELLDKYSCSEKKKAEYIELVKESQAWHEVYYDLYSGGKVSVYMDTDVHLYVEGEAHCINDVIRIRRKMLGWSVEKLAEGVCSVRTIRRIEGKKSSPQREEVSELFEKMGLPYELHRTDLITMSYEAKRLKEKLDSYALKKEYKKAKECIEQIEALIDMSIPLNQQTVLSIKLANEKGNKLITGEEYEKGVKQALECTISYDNVISDKEKYFTNAELECIHNIAMVRANWKDNELMYIQKEMMELLEKKAPIHSYIIIYEFIMRTIASYLGNIGEYEESDILSQHVLELCLMCRRTRIVKACIYNNVWNNKMRNNRTKYNSAEKETIDKAILISRFCKDEYYEKVYAYKRDN